MVEEYIRHCRVEAEQVLVGVPDGKGIVQGGQLKVREEIVGRVFGSPGGVPTLLQVGDESNAALDAHRAGRVRERALAEKLNEVNRIGALLLAKAKATGATEELKDKLRKVSATKKHLEAELKNLRATLRELAIQAALSEASITAYDTLHPNVQLIIDGVVGKIRVERNNCIYRLKDGKFMRRRITTEDDLHEAEAEIDDIAEETLTGPP